LLKFLALICLEKEYQIKKFPLKSVNEQLMRFLVCWYL